MLIVIISIHNAGVINAGHKAREIWSVKLLKTLAYDMNLSLNLLQAKTPHNFLFPELKDRLMQCFSRKKYFKHSSQGARYGSLLF